MQIDRVKINATIQKKLSQKTLATGIFYTLCQDIKVGNNLLFTREIELFIYAYQHHEKNQSKLSHADYIGCI